eukprot:TRINITY_DN1135_c3_g1_i1.p1 TRINITY_DN1135_c3_g1~~TRINITY_DN1135_c3_g1_i1.p1  ORF type:complete len:234 (-),score=34.84 TRINITY_DN1135_c3_g1_i1:68-769(-)
MLKLNSFLLFFFDLHFYFFPSSSYFYLMEIPDAHSIGKVSCAIQPDPFPMPFGLVGAKSQGGVFNVMPAAFLGMANHTPPVICMGINPNHQTAKFIEESGYFSVSLPHRELAERADACGLMSGKNVDKSKMFNLFTGKTGCPMVRDCRFCCECKLLKVEKAMPGSMNSMYIGEISGIFADSDVVVNGKPDWARIAPMFFTFPDAGLWALGPFIEKAWNCGSEIAKSEKLKQQK